MKKNIKRNLFQWRVAFVADTDTFKTWYSDPVIATKTPKEALDIYFSSHPGRSIKRLQEQFPNCQIIEDDTKFLLSFENHNSSHRAWIAFSNKKDVLPIEINGKKYSLGGYLEEADQD